MTLSEANNMAATTVDPFKISMKTALLLHILTEGLFIKCDFEALIYRSIVSNHPQHTRRQ